MPPSSSATVTTATPSEEGVSSSAPENSQPQVSMIVEAMPPQKNPPTLRPSKSPPLSPTSKRKPAPLLPPNPAVLSVQTRQYSDDRFEANSITYSNVSPPSSPRVLSPLWTSPPSPPLMLASLKLGSSPPLEPSALPYSAGQSYHSQGGGKGSVKTFQRGRSSSSLVRRAPSIESPVRDPYRFRTPNASAKGVKSEYQTQGQPYPQGGYGAYSASEDFQEAIGAHQGYQAPQHQSHQSYSSSQHIYSQAPVSGMAYNYATGEERQDQRTDPYRSAYSQQQHLQHGSLSLNHESPGVPFDEINQMTFSSRHSINSSGGVNAADQQYPMHSLQSKNSSHALSPSFHQNQTTGPTPASSIFESQSDRYQDNAEESVLGLTTRQPYAMHEQSRQNTEEDENAEILRKVSQSGTRSGISQGSISSSLGRKRLTGGKRRKRGLSSSEDSEEEGQEQGEIRRRDPKRCWCCSRRMCVYMSFVLLICLGTVLYFVVPRSPGFSYLSVASLGDPVVTSDQIQEPFSLQLQVDSSDNYLPIKINSIEMTVWIKLDQTNIGNNDNLSSSFVIHPKTIQTVSIPMVIDYTSLQVDTNADGTFQELIAACTPVDPNSGALVQGINLTFGGKINVWGLSWVWKPQFSFNVNSVPCPVNARNTTTMPSPTLIAPQPSSSGGVIASQTVSGTPGATKSSGTPSQTTTGGTSSSSNSSTLTA